MPHRRKGKKGSFAGHLDELVKHFPDDDPKSERCERDDQALKEKLDILALLFERAWQMEGRE
jgi:hypothetical protein